VGERIKGSIRENTKLRRKEEVLRGLSVLKYSCTPAALVPIQSSQYRSAIYSKMPVESARAI
jgi:hypothetical protein